MTAKDFFDQFVFPRRPCVLTLDKSIETDLSSLIKNWKSNDYLRQKAGNQLIDVEVRHEQQGQTFGRQMDIIGIKAYHLFIRRRLLSKYIH